MGILLLKHIASALLSSVLLTACSNAPLTNNPNTEVPHYHISEPQAPNSRLGTAHYQPPTYSDSTDTRASTVRYQPQTHSHARLAASSIFKCPANAATESSFKDTFSIYGNRDIKWTGPLSSEMSSVDDIAAAFNYARARDATVHGKLIMPAQAEWNAMSASQKGLFLVNSERCARGIEPFEGIAPEMIASSANYVNEISDGRAFSHGFGVYADPWKRLEGYGNVHVGTNADLFAYGENLSVSTASNTAGYPTIYEPVARAIYGYMYEDKRSRYGHRKFNLAVIDNDNSGWEGAEGLFGLSVKRRQNAHKPRAGFFQAEAKTVMHVFDPNEHWNMRNVLAAPRIFGPQDAADCLSGRFVRSFDNGNNTSSCQR